MEVAVPGPLAGVRVIDCSTGTAGPRATGILADYGADVIWVEPPGGDRFRAELAAQYSVFNRGKRSIIIDLREPSGRARLFDLLATADVLVESWSPGVADALGLGYDELHGRFPRLVQASISGFGQDGPHRDTPGYESLVHALVGTMGEQPGHREGPIFQGLPFASIGAASLAVIGIAAALYRRFDDGHGRQVETSLLDGALVYLSMLWGDADIPPPPRDPGSKRLIARNFACADDEVIGVHTGAVGAFGRLMSVLGLSDKVPASESGLDMGIALTPQQRALLDEHLPAVFASETRETWLARLTEADICAIPLLHAGEVFDQPQVIHNNMVVRVEDPALGPLEQVAPAISFARTPAGAPGPAPRPGEHDETALPAGEQPGLPMPAGEALADRPVLDGLRVLDLGAFFAGPYGSRLLADLGADVIRVETLAGDPNRGSEVIFRSGHAGLRSLAMDLKHPDARPVIEKLIAWADVVHHSMRPGAAERLGVGYEQVRAINPQVVYAYGPGWGASGPLAKRQSFAPLMSGYVGVAYEVSGQFNPPVYPAGNEDPGNGLLGAMGMLIGLLHRRASGEGQSLEHPQLNAALTHVAHIVRQPDGTTIGDMRLDPMQLGVSPLDRLYETADGWLCVVAGSPAEIAALGKALDVDLASDERFADVAGCEANADELGWVLGEAFAARPTAELLDALRAADVAAIVPVDHHNSRDFLRDPENLRTGRSVECPHEARGRVREVGRLIRVGDAVPAPHRLAPGLGEHNDEILAGLGFDDAAVAALREARAIS